MQAVTTVTELYHTSGIPSWIESLPPGVMGNCLKGESDEDDISLLHNEVVDDEADEMSGSTPQPLHHIPGHQEVSKFKPLSLARPTTS